MFATWARSLRRRAFGRSLEHGEAGEGDCHNYKLSQHLKQPGEGDLDGEEQEEMREEGEFLRREGEARSG